MVDFNRIFGSTGLKTTLTDAQYNGGLDAFLGTNPPKKADHNSVFEELDLKASYLNDVDIAHAAAADPHTQYLQKSDTVSQVDAEAGISTIVRAWTALRVKQAIQALVQSATETVEGIVERATQAEVDAGTDDTRYVSPLKMRFGFSILLATNGYIVFPTWLGGLILQWGETVAFTTGNTVVINFPLAFPNSYINANASPIMDAAYAGGDTTSAFVFPVSKSQMKITLDASGITKTKPVSWLAIGH